MSPASVCVLITFFWTAFNQIRDASGHNQNCDRITTFNYHYTPTFDLVQMDGFPDQPGVNFNFSVRAVSDGHLKLSTTPDPKLSPVTLEIVLGAGANTFSALRRRPKKSPLDLTVNTYRVLSDREMRNFSLYLAGEVLLLYANDSASPIFRYEDSSIPDMRYIAFGAWNNVGVEWSFNCKNAEMPDPEMKNPLYRLKADYWAHYDPFNPPILDNQTLVIDVALSLKYVNLDVKEASFSMRGHFSLKWTDQKLKWNPNDYGNITNLNFKHRVIWMPDFVPLNSPKADNPILSDRSVLLDHSGVANWKSDGSTETWCAADVSSWPADEHTCEVHVGLHSYPQNVWINLSQSDDLQNSLMPGLEWEIVSVLMEEAEKFDAETNDENGGAQSFKIIVTLRRISSPYMLLFIGPITVSYVVLMSSFIIEPRYSSRLFLVATAAVTLYVFLLLEENALPALPRGTPRIIKTTSSLFLMAIVQLVFHSFNVHVATLVSQAPKFVQNAAKKPWMKYLHRATFVSFVENENLAEPGETESVTTDRCIDSDDQFTNKYHWALVSRALDAIAFIISFLIVPTIVLTNY
ncbi:LRRCT [Nesidiocoris tenuis]|uniref:LRRCT n=1 Tax=Nesidiocoris tenuis TaxID=355587 RepID=A0ABN7B8M7_9HEMI|nr:LRRCT [Nesidiocoris tenuis]